MIHCALLPRHVKQYVVRQADHVGHHVPMVVVGLTYSTFSRVVEYLTNAPRHGKMGGMIRKPVISKVLLALTVAGLVLPMMICVVLSLAWLLPVMGDQQGGTVLRYVAEAGGIVWTMVLIGLIFVQAIHSLGRSDDADQ
jgi:hypothetical protein